MNKEALLEEFAKLVRERSDGRNKSRNVDAIKSLWSYLTDRPGAPLTQTEFGGMLSVAKVTAKARLDDLVQLGLLKQTVARRGKGGGAGYQCDWFEERRNSKTPKREVPAVDEPRSNSNSNTVRCELGKIEELADRCIKAVAPLIRTESRMGYEFKEAMLEIQAGVNKIQMLMAPPSG